MELKNTCPKHLSLKINGSGFSTEVATVENPETFLIVSLDCNEFCNIEPETLHKPATDFSHVKFLLSILFIKKLYKPKFLH